MRLDIEKLFKENHRNMDESPPISSWEKIRNRLENHRTHNKIRRIHGMSIAAVVFAFISFGIVCLMYMQYQADHSHISAHSYQQNLQLLDLTTDSENDIYSIHNVKDLHKTLIAKAVRMN